MVTHPLFAAPTAYATSHSYHSLPTMPSDAYIPFLIAGMLLTGTSSPSVAHLPPSL